MLPPHCLKYRRVHAAPLCCFVSRIQWSPSWSWTHRRNNATEKKKMGRSSPLVHYIHPHLQGRQQPSRDQGSKTPSTHVLGPVGPRIRRQIRRPCEWNMTCADLSLAHNNTSRIRPAARNVVSRAGKTLVYFSSIFLLQCD